MFRKINLIRFKPVILNFIHKKSYLILLLFVLSCEFQPSDIPLTQVKKPSDNAPSLLIEVIPDMDTLKLASDVWTEYKIHTVEAEIRWVRILFDETEVYNGNYDASYLPRVPVVTGNYTEGMHYITIQTFTSDNSGSIADKTGAEGFLFEAVWPVIIAHNVSPVINIRSLKFNDPGVEVVWDKYDYYGFQSYQFSKGTLIEGNKVEKQFTNSKQTRYIDYSYIEGEYAWYSVSLYGWYSDSKEYVKPIEAPVIEQLPGQKLKVNWKKTTNPGLLGNYHVKLSAPIGALSEESVLSNPVDTSVTFNTPGFGGEYEIQVRYVPKTYTGPYINYNSAGGTTTWAPGNPMPSFNRGFNLNETGGVLLYDQGKFLKYNVEAGKVSDSLGVNIADPENIRVTETGKFFSYFINDEFVLRETATWNIVNQFKVPFYYFNSLNARTISISDNYQLVVVDHWSVFSVYDCRSGNEVFRKVGDNINSIMKAEINSDGTKIAYLEFVNYGSEKVLRLANLGTAELVDIGEIKTADYDYKTWVSFAGNEIIILNNTSGYNYTGEVRSNVDFSVISQMKFPDRFVPIALDSKNKQAVLKYGYSGGYDYGYVVDLKTSVVEKTIPYLGDYRSQYILSGGIVMSGTGKYLSVNELKSE